MLVAWGRGGCDQLGEALVEVLELALVAFAVLPALVKVGKLLGPQQVEVVQLLGKNRLQLGILLELVLCLGDACSVCLQVERLRLWLGW